MSIIENLNAIKSCKEDIKQAIIDKGQDLTDIPFSGYAQKIQDIETGITPIGTYGIELNGLYDITNFSAVKVNVPTEGYLIADVVQKGYRVSWFKDSNILKIRSGAFFGEEELSGVWCSNVYNIGDYAFQDCMLLQFARFDAVSDIGKSAFYMCYNLSYFACPNVRTINESAFYYCWSMTDFYVGSYTGNYPWNDKVTIKSHAFESTGLNGFNVFSCMYLGDNALYACKNLSSVSLPFCEYVGAAAFDGCVSLPEISLPLVSQIGEDVFANCSNLSNIYLGIDNYKMVEYKNNMFFNTPIASGTGSIYVDAALYESYINDTNWSSFSSQIVSVGDINDPVISWSTTMTGRVIRTWDGDNLNNDFAGITTVSFPSCIWLGSSAFEGCSTLTSVTLDNCEVIGDNAFSNCTKLSSFNGLNVNIVGEGAFYNCESLTYIDLPNCWSVGEGAFSFVYSNNTVSTALSYLSLPNCGYIGKGGISNASALTYLNLDGLEEIHPYAIQYCHGLNSMSFPNVIKIFNNGFFNNNNCYQIDLPVCSYIGRFGLAFNRGTLNVSMPQCNYLENKAFYRCNALQTVSLPCFSSIGNFVFEQCFSLSKVYLGDEYEPNTVKYIGTNIFSNCSTPITLTIDTGAVPSFPYSSFGVAPSSIYVRSSLVDAYKNAENWSYYSSIIFPIPE